MTRQSAEPSATAPTPQDEALTAWAKRWASTLQPFTPDEIAAVGRLVAVIDARIARKAGDAG